MLGVKRPSNKDTEEDLLKFQQQFVENLSNDPDFKPKISVDLVNPHKPAVTKPTTDNSRNKMEEKMDQHDSSLPSLLRKVTETVNVPKPVFPQESNLPFPKAIGIDLRSLQQSATTDSRSKKKSLFALHMEKQAKGVIPTDNLNFPASQELDDDVIQMDTVDSNVLKPTLITGEGLVNRDLDAKSEIDKIHQENIDRLSRMTKDEILQEQEKIKTTLDPNLLDFLKNRKRKQNTAETNPQEMETVSEQNLDSCGEIQGLISEAKKQKWEHFDVLEAEKLEWMQGKEENVKKQVCKPRFDFSGGLITSNDSITTDMGLFHHGEDSDQPGYTLEELIHLSESTFQSQKMLSLQTLSCIAKMAQNDNSIHQKLESNLLKVMIDISVPVIFRVAMDSSTLPVLCIGILGIRNLLVNDLDMKFLTQIQDTSFGLSLPFLNSNIEPLQDSDSEISDIEIIQKDLVQGLIKTNILTRIRYILQTIKPPDTSVICCLEILLHFARYAKSIAIQVINDEKLINTILVNFLPFNLSLEKDHGSYGQPCVEAINLFYYLILASKTCSSTLVVKHKIIVRLIQFALLDINEFKTKKGEITMLITASLHSLRGLACYGLGLEYFQSSYDRFISKLQGYYAKYTELSGCKYDCLTPLIRYITEVSLALAYSRQHRIELLNPIIEIVQGICDKATLAIQIEINTAQQRVLSAIYNMFSTLITKPVVSKFASPVDLLSNIETFATVQYIKLCQSKAVKQLFTSFIQHSTNLEKSPKVYHDKSLLLNTTVESDYIIVSDMMYSIVNSIESAKRQLPHLKIKSFLEVSGLYQLMHNYLQSLLTRTNSPPAFFILETPIIYKLLVSCEDDLDKSLREKKLIQNIFFCLVVWLQSGQECFLKEIFHSHIFSPKYYITKDHQAMTGEELRSIKFTYDTLLQFVNVNQVTIEFSTKLYYRNRVDLDSLALPSFHSPIFPIDWVTMPIFILYNKEESKPDIPGGFQTNVRFLTDCLKFYIYVETNDIVSISYIKPSARVARIMLAFLLGDMFLTDEINTQLSAIIDIYSDHDFLDNLDFSGPIQGVTDFAELYSELCTHFTSVSFGDPTYALFLLLPLISNPSTQLKLIIWRNNMEIFRLFPLPISDISLPIDRLLHPYETNHQVITSMIQALIQEKVRITWSPVFYLMAVHHIRAFIGREPSDSNEKAIGVNLVNALLSGNDKLLENFVGYSEKLSVSGKSFKKSDSSSKLVVNSVYEADLMNFELSRIEGENIGRWIDFV